MTNMYKKIFIILGVVLVVTGGIVLIFTYVFRVDSPAVTAVRKTLHLPAIIVDGQWISMTELEENTASIKQFYESQDFSQFGIRKDFTTDDGKKRLQLKEREMINKLIEDIAIEQMADEWDIDVSDEAVRTAMDRPMKEAGTKENVESKLEDLYGWSLEDFGRKVVYGQLLREKVGAKFEQENPITAEMTEKLSKAKNELGDNRTFADVAMKYSEGATANNSGVMGWFAQNQLQDEIGKQIFTMQKGQSTDAIETPLGLHLVRVNDISEIDGQKLVHVSQIVIKRQTFADFLNQKISKMKVQTFLPQYKWNAQEAMIVFSDDAMTQFEKNTYEEAQKAQEALLNSQNVEEHEDY